MARIDAEQVQHDSARIFIMSPLIYFRFYCTPYYYVTDRNLELIPRISLSSSALSLIGRKGVSRQNNLLCCFF